MVLYRDLDFDGDNDILAGVQGLRSPLHITLDPSKATADADGRKSFDPGQWIAESGNYGRILPRSKNQAALTTASTVVTVSNAQAFVVGDVLHIVPPSAQITIALVWAAADTLDVTIQGYTYTFTAAGADTDAIAAGVAAGINADPVLKDLVVALSAGSDIHIYAKAMDGLYTIATTANTAGTGTGAVLDSATNLVPLRTIGTIDAGGVDVVNNQLTLASTAAVAVPVGMPIGTNDTVLGLFLRALDLIEGSLEIGVYKSASIKQAALAYYDETLVNQFPEIITV